MTESNLPEKLSAPAKRALDAAGYTTLEQFSEVSEADLLKLHGVGPDAIKKLRAALSEMGLSFADTAAD